MQIPPASTAAQAAGIFAQSAVKDKSAASSPASDVTANAAHVEKSGSSSSDRDAQGQGDGLGGRHSRNAEIDQAKADHDSQHETPVAHWPDEPPSQLDIVG